MEKIYRGRMAPSPTGFLHLGHARTFWIAHQRARNSGGKIILRNEDLDGPRCKPEFVQAMLDDLKWLGLDWDEGPEVGGAFGPYEQSERFEFYKSAFDALRERGLVYPCYCSRQDVARALRAPHQGEEEPIYPGTCRGRSSITESQIASRKPHWRFRVNDGEIVGFDDRSFGFQEFVAGKDFGDFVVWRNDDIPSYQLAVVVDDSTMGISEVVRGADLLLSTARQILLYRALSRNPPDFFHCPLMMDEHGMRLAKRSESMSLRTMKLSGMNPRQLRAGWQTQGFLPPRS